MMIDTDFNADFELCLNAESERSLPRRAIGMMSAYIKGFQPEVQNWQLRHGAPTRTQILDAGNTKNAAHYGWALAWHELLQATKSQTGQAHVDKEQAIALLEQSTLLAAETVRELGGEGLLKVPTAFYGLNDEVWTGIASYYEPREKSDYATVS